MRRLAKQSRKDTYKSTRDYQEIYEETTKRIAVVGTGPHKISFSNSAFATTDKLQAWGVYIASTSSVLLIVQVKDNGGAGNRKTFELQDEWRRIGGLLDGVDGNKLELTFEWEGNISLDIWGLASGTPLLTLDDGKHQDRLQIGLSHLVPETFYLAHDVSVGLDPQPDESTRFSFDEGRLINLKKCSYCGRQLPLDPNRLGMLAFHKHNDKKSKHQNECRACKKWRINDTFNPIRTPDQLHESSVITRERKIFLREPERLQEIKDRTGAGLRSQVWNRFGRKCFRCEVTVELDGFQLDHTRPLAYLWPIDEFATCLCGTCNNEKKEKFPVDFYTPDQIARLSKITGLSEFELNVKDVNEVELKRVLADLSGFARKWEPRTFFATAHKILELRPQVDLMILMRVQDEDLFEHLQQQNKMRLLARDEE